jgi:hypothetical protein
MLAWLIAWKVVYHYQFREFSKRAMIFVDAGIDNTALIATPITTLDEHMAVLVAEVKKANQQYEIEKVLTWKEKSSLRMDVRGQ